MALLPNRSLEAEKDAKNIEMQLGIRRKPCVSALSMTVCLDLIICAVPCVRRPGMPALARSATGSDL